MARSGQSLCQLMRGILFRSLVVLVPRMSWQTSVLLSLLMLSHAATGVSGFQKRQAGTVTSTSPVLDEQFNSTKNRTGEEPNNKSNTGAVVAASVIAVLVCIALVLAVYMFKRRRQSRMMDKEKKMQIQMSSARNAGVYQDLTVSVPGDEKAAVSPEQERLKAAEEV